MPRVLFDKNVPYPLKRFLNGFQVQTAEDEGWGQIENGALIAHAEAAGYQILVTCDQNIQYQQNLNGRKISMVVLGSNIWPGIVPRLAEITDALTRATARLIRIHRNHSATKATPVDRPIDPRHLPPTLIRRLPFPSFLIENSTGIEPSSIAELHAKQGRPIQISHWRAVDVIPFYSRPFVAPHCLRHKRPIIPYIIPRVINIRAQHQQHRPR